MCRVRLVSLLTASVVLFALSACEDPLNPPGVDPLVGRWRKVSEGIDEGALHRDSSVIEFRVAKTGMWYWKYAESDGISGEAKSTYEYRENFTWSTDGDTLTITSGACEERDGGAWGGTWQFGRDWICQEGSVAKAAYRIEGNMFIRSSAGNDSIGPVLDTMHRMN